MTPASSLDDRELVRQLVESAIGATSESAARVSELQSELLLRLDAAARPESLEVSPSDVVTIYRANGALAAKCEVMAVLARRAEESEDAEHVPGIMAALLAVARMK